MFSRFLIQGCVTVYFTGARVRPGVSKQYFTVCFVSELGYYTRSTVYPMGISHCIPPSVTVHFTDISRRLHVYDTVCFHGHVTAYFTNASQCIPLVCHGAFCEYVSP